MLQMLDGRIKMTAEERANYLEFSGCTRIPLTKSEFTQTLLQAAATMRDRLASGKVRPNDNIIKAELIEEYLSSPHVADLRQRHRDWLAAGCPIGEEAMRKAGLSNPALDRIERERAAGQGSFSQVEGERLPKQIGPNASEGPIPEHQPLNLKSAKSPWVSIQSAVGQTELFDTFAAREKST